MSSAPQDLKISSTSDNETYDIKRDNGDLVTFYHGLTLEQQSSSKTKSNSRIVHVGDVVVVDCPEDDEEILYPPRMPNAKGWYPLDRPWKVGVIVALWGTIQKKPNGARATERFDMTVVWLRHARAVIFQHDSRDEAANGSSRVPNWQSIKERLNMNAPVMSH